MSNNFNFDLYDNEKPPLPPKNAFISGPPLPPKLKNLKEIHSNEVMLKPTYKTKPKSKNLLINNTSYSLTSNIIDNNKVIEQENKIKIEENYENYELNIIETPHLKKNSLVNKMKKLLKKPKRNSKLPKNDETNNKISVLIDNKYNEMPIDKMKCSNVSTCSNCTPYCRTCHCLIHSICQYHIRCINTFVEHEHHHVSTMNSSCYCHSRISSSNNCSSLSDCHCNTSLRNSHAFDQHYESHKFPIIPNRSMIKPSENLSLPPNMIEQESKPIEVIRPSPSEKYSVTFLNKNLMELKKVGWYWGSVSSEEVERIMTNRPDGTFLVRDSAHSEHLFSVTFRVNHLTHHARIQFSQNRFWWNRNNKDDGFGSIIELIENTLEISRKGEYRYFENTENTSIAPYAVSLWNPLSRFNYMSSLKHLTRFIIITNVRNDHLDLLPLPPNLLSYLHDKEHHYIENFDRYVNIMDSSESLSYE